MLHWLLHRLLAHPHGMLLHIRKILLGKLLLRAAHHWLLHGLLLESHGLLVLLKILLLHRLLYKLLLHRLLLLLLHKSLLHRLLLLRWELLLHKLLLTRLLQKLLLHGLRVLHQSIDSSAAVERVKATCAMGTLGTITASRRGRGNPC